MNTCSIILPVYNAEAYLKETLDSIIKNLHADDELIIVNDGSNDNSAEIIKPYLSANVHLITKKNEGVSIARNVGMERAKKDYLFFIDSDDLINDGIFDVIHNTDFHNCDLVVGKNMIHLYNETKTEKLIENLKKFKLSSKEETIADFISAKDNLGIWAVWRHLFRREFIMKEKLRFDASYSYAEDMDFIMNVINHASSFGLINTPLVKYRIHSASVSGNYSIKSMKSHLAVLYKWQNYYHNSSFEKFNKKRIINKLANKQIAMLAHVSHLVSSQQEAYFDAFALSSKYLKYSSGKFKYVYLIGKLIGYEKVSKIIGGRK